MKKIITAIVFAVASLGASLVAASFEEEFDSFRKSIKSYSNGRVEDPVSGIITLNSDIPHDNYVRFSHFLLDESLKIYTVDYIIGNKAESLRDVLYLNLNEMYCSDEDLDFAVENLYRVLITGFCLCLMDYIETQRIVRPLTPKF